MEMICWVDNAFYCKEVQENSSFLVATDFCSIPLRKSEAMPHVCFRMLLVVARSYLLYSEPILIVLILSSLASYIMNLI
jgi:hypothetical protein